MLKVYLSARQVGSTTDLFEKIKKVDGTSLLICPTVAICDFAKKKCNSPVIIKSVKEIVDKKLNGVEIDSVFIDNLEKISPVDLEGIYRAIKTDEIIATFNPTERFLEDAFLLAKQVKKGAIIDVDCMFALIRKHGVIFEYEYRKAYGSVLTNPEVELIYSSNNDFRFSDRVKVIDNVSANIFK